MQPAGLVQVEAARSDGRWATAYAGRVTMVMPEDFLAALKQDHIAHAFYAMLKRQSLFTIYHLLHSAKRQETRAKANGGAVGEVGPGEGPRSLPAERSVLALRQRI